MHPISWRDRVLSGLKKLRLEKSFDEKLVRRLRPRVAPGLAQLKYLPRFFSEYERKVIGIAFAVLITASVLSGLIFLKSHIVVGPKSGGEYSESLVGQPKYLNPLFASTNDIDADLSSLIYQGLFSSGENGRLEPLLAAGYQISKDGKTYTITIKNGLVWSDSEPLTADDVLFTFDAIQNPDLGSPLLPAFQGVSVEKLDDYTVRFILPEPFAPFLNSLTVGILPEHIWSDLSPGTLKLAKTNLEPIGSGPWKFSKLFKDETGKITSLLLVRNPNFFGAAPYFKSLTFKFFDDYEQAVESLKSHNVTAISFLPRDPKFKITSSAIQTYPFSLPQYTAIFFNQSGNSPVKDKDLREALSAALNRGAVISEALDGAGVIVDSPFLPGILKGPSPAPLSYNPDEANRLLDKAWPRIEPEEYFKIKLAELAPKAATGTTATGTAANDLSVLQGEIRKDMSPEQLFYRKDKDGRLLALTITTADTPEYKRAAGVIARYWRAVGVQTFIEAVPAQQITRDVIKPRGYEALLYGELVGGDPDPYPFWHSSQINYPGLNLSGYINRTADKLLEDARAEVDNAKRNELYKKFSSRLLADRVAIFLYTPAYQFAAYDEIKGINLGNLATPASRYSRLGEWYSKTSWRWKR